MNVTILDETITNTVRTLPCFTRLADHEVTIWKTIMYKTKMLSPNGSAETEVLVLIRERTKDTRSLARSSAEAEADQPAQRMATYRRRRLHPARNCRFVRRAYGTPCYATAELTCTDPRRYASDTAADAALKAGRWQIGVAAR